MLTRTKVFSLTIATLLVLTLIPGALTGYAGWISSDASDWVDLGEAQPGATNINALIGAPGGKIIGGTIGSGPYLFKYDISSSTFTSAMQVPGTGSYVSRLALGSGDQVYVSTSRTYGLGNLASYDPQSDTLTDLGTFDDEYGDALAVGLDGKVYVGTCCQGKLSIYDPQTQSWTYIGTIISDQRRITGLTVAPDGDIYGVTSRIWVYPYGGAVLFKFDPISQSTTVIGTIWSGPRESWNIVTNPHDGRLYGSVGRAISPRLFVFDPANPHLGIQDLGNTPVAGADQIGAGTLTIAPDGKVYAITLPDPYRHMVVYDPSNPGAGIVDVGPLGEGHGPLAFGTDDRLYGTNGTHLLRNDSIPPPTDPTEWELLGFAGNGALSIAYSPNYANDRTIYVGIYDDTGSYLFRSTDKGADWTVVDIRSSFSVRSIVFSPNYVNDHTLFIGGDTGNGVRRSNDGGATWTDVGPTGETAWSLAISPNYANDRTLFAGTSTGHVFRSVDGGDNWVDTGLILSSYTVRALAISPDYANDRTIFAGMGKSWEWYDGGVYRSTDGGDTWAEVNNGLAYQEVWALTISPNYSSDQTLFVAVWAGGVYRSTDGGNSWVEANNGQPNRRPGNGPTLIFSPNYGSDQTVFYGTWGEYSDGGVYRSTDGGESWTVMNTGLDTRWLHALAVPPNYSSDPVLLAGGERSNGGGLWVYSEDDTTPPIAITDLVASTGSGTSEVDLTWTAPGDDGGTGTAMTYTVRYADSPIVSGFGWIMATDVDGEPTPQAAGSSESMTVSGLTPGETYYFAIKTEDEASNMSDLSNSPSATAKDGPAWTLVFYMDGDNDLDGNYIAAFNQLESAADNHNVNIVVAWDRSANGNSAYYEIQHDTNLDEVNPAADYTDDVNRWPQNELRMNDSTTLSDFIQWARTNYPAQYYALIISDHGTGLGGLATDSGSGDDWLEVAEWRTALATATSDGTDKIDVVFADACLMAMIEDAHQIRDYTDYYVASENLIWVTGGSTSGPYDDYVSSIGETTSPRDFAIALVNGYRSWLDADYSEDSGYPFDLGYTISAVDLAELADLVSATNALASELESHISDYSSQISNARADTQTWTLDKIHIWWF